MKNRIVLAGTLLTGMLLASCSMGNAEPTSTPVDIGAMQTQAVQTAYADLTLNAPTATLTPTITPTPTQTSTPTITPTPTQVHLSLADNLAIYMINILDQEACSYEILPIPISEPITGDIVADTQTALRYLLNTKWYKSGYLTNPMYTSSLQVERIELSGTSMTIRLTGVMSRYDDVCTNNEARQQVWATASRYNVNLTEIIIWVDTLLFDDFMIGS